MWKSVLTYFDKLEDRVRTRLSRKPILYAVIGAIGIILIWKGVEDTAESIGLTGLFAFFTGLGILLLTGLLVSFFIGEGIIISGLKREKKVVEKTENELKEEQEKVDRIATELSHIEKEVKEIKNFQGRTRI